MILKAEGCTQSANYTLCLSSIQSLSIRQKSRTKGKGGMSQFYWRSMGKPRNVSNEISRKKPLARKKQKVPKDEDKGLKPKDKGDWGAG